MENLNSLDPLKSPLSTIPYEYAPDGQTAVLGDFGWCFQAARGMQGLITLLLNDRELCYQQRQGSNSQTLSREHGDQLFAALSALGVKLVQSLEEWRFDEGDEDTHRQKAEAEDRATAHMALMVWQSQITRLRRSLHEWPPGIVRDQLIKVFGPWLTQADKATEEHCFDGVWWTDVRSSLVLIGKTLDQLYMTMAEARRLAAMLQLVTEQALTMQKIATRIA